jgi:transposase
MSSGKRQKKYDESFRREAVRLVEEEGMSAAQVERDLGITRSLVSRWCKALKEDKQTPFPGRGYQRPEKAELTQLKRENARLKRERDILKKAMAIFSEDQ